MEALNFAGGFLIGGIFAAFIMGLLVFALDPN